MSKIIQLQGENIKRLRAVTIDIDPDGHALIIGGGNGAGKTSTSDIIWYVLKGKGVMPSEPLRKGAEKGFGKLTLDNGLIITRRITKKGTTLKIEGPAGDYPSPQTLLDGMTGSTIAFDPMAFTRMEPKQQLEALRDLLGVDTGVLDAERDAQYATRTAYNRKIKDLRSQLTSIVYAAGGPDEEVNVSLLMSELEEYEAAQLDHVDAIAAIEELERVLAMDLENIEELKADVARMQVAIKGAKARLPRMRKAVDAMPLPDPDAVRDQIRQADDVNRNVRAKAQHKALHERIVKGEDEVGKMTRKIEDIDQEKRELVEEAKFPVKGLSFGEDHVRFNGIPFDQCSNSEQIRVSVGMALAANPELKLVLIRDGSLLDAESRQIVVEMAEDADGLAVIELVSTDAKECSVIIEDGLVK